MPHLLRVIYVSRSTGPIEASALETLMEASRSHNENAGISGILCSGRGYFVQALEGSEAAVVPLYASILRDKRHQQSALLSIGLVSSRAFPQWSMALVEGELLGAEMHAKLVDQVLLDRDPTGPVKLLQASLKALRKAA
jgi:hypothetical protein